MKLQVTQANWAYEPVPRIIDFTYVVDMKVHSHRGQTYTELVFDKRFTTPGMGGRFETFYVFETIEEILEKLNN